MNGESMDAIYRYQRHFYDLTRKYYLLGRDRLVAELEVPEGGTVLEIGCGTGRNLIKMARAYPSVRLFGLDISNEMLSSARASVARAGLSHRITLVQGDATNFDPQALFAIPAFDRVVMSYTLSMIPDWRAALRQGTQALAEGGRLHLVDFGQQEHLPRWFKRALFAWLAKFGVSPRGELGVAIASLDPNTTLQSLYRDYARAAVISRA
jgi:S-adenosylmethionine-diacylgycerolhomoserine-N-methlytransferase